jgi:hypothetical protein
MMPFKHPPAPPEPSPAYLEWLIQHTRAVDALARRLVRKARESARGRPNRSHLAMTPDEDLDQPLLKADGLIEYTPDDEAWLKRAERVKPAVMADIARIERPV